MAELDLERLFTALAENKVEYVLIGGLAAVLHGSPFPTEDADITPRRSPDNLTNLVAALKELRARIRTDQVPEGLPFSFDSTSLAAANVWNLTTDAGDLDISFTPDGTDGYLDLMREATEVPLAGVRVWVSSLSDVVRSKQAANRPKDQRVLPALRKLLNRDR
jgi:predicted nucleotidyltransferase